MRTTTEMMMMMMMIMMNSIFPHCHHDKVDFHYELMTVPMNSDLTIVMVMQITANLVL